MVQLSQLTNAPLNYNELAASSYFVLWMFWLETNINLGVAVAAVAAVVVDSAWQNRGDRVPPEHAAGFDYQPTHYDCGHPGVQYSYQSLFAVVG